MVETFTPAVCGSRRRQRLALAGFAAGAVAASAVVGAALGALGALIGVPLVLAVAGIAVLAAAREAGLARLPLPQIRRQVPERWRAELPLPVWSVGYGLGLGAGFLTFQPVATFWVACATAVALGRPLVAAACFAAYGAGRAVMAVWPGRRHEDAVAAVEALARRRGILLRVNVVALLVCAALLAASSAGAAVTNVGPGVDPSAGGNVLARGRVDSGSSSVLVEPEGDSPIAVAGAGAPAVDGDLLAYDDSKGIRVINWRTGALVARVDGAVAKPSLDWPRLAFVRTGREHRRLILANFSDPAAPTRRVITRIARRNDLGRPSLAAGRIAWHVVTRGGSRVFVERLAGGSRTLVARSKIAVESNPALTRRRILWVEQRAQSAFVRVRRLGRSGSHTIYGVKTRRRRLSTTDITGRTAYVTRWSPATGASTLIRVNF
jgi:hypothetical protein